MSQDERAVFCFLPLEAGKAIEPVSVLHKLLAIAAANKSFSRFVAYIEIPKEKSMSSDVDLDVHLGEHEGNIAYLHHDKLKHWLANKRATEEQNRRRPGHGSYRPAMVLRTNTCVVAMGSRGFCATVARVHMEEIASLRLKLIDILEQLCSLRTFSRRQNIAHEDLLIVDVNQDPKNYITYNLCWMWERVQEFSEIVDFPKLVDQEDDSNLLE